MMSLGERCDEILRIIDEALEEGGSKGVPGRGDAWTRDPMGSLDSSERHSHERIDRDNRSMVEQALIALGGLGRAG